MSRVLLVEDDASLREVTATVLRSGGLSVETCGDGLTALQRFASNPYDLVLLDLMLPGTDGFSVCREIRKVSGIPIVMLTARRDTPDLVAGLELGADDYITKPFEAPALLARVRAVLRRAQAPVDLKLRTRNFRVDLEAYRVWKDDEEVALSTTEFKLLVELIRHAGQVLTREQLLQQVWGYDYLGDSRLVDMAIKRLRGKIDDPSAETSHIATVRGVGYRFDREDD